MKIQRAVLSDLTPHQKIEVFVKGKRGQIALDIVLDNEGYPCITVMPDLNNGQKTQVNTVSYDGVENSSLKTEDQILVTICEA